MMKTEGNEKFLDLIEIASPCPVDWASMSGDDARRFCSQCKLHVYNLSEMTEKQAEQFVRQQSGKKKPACVRFFRRADGTILTRDCHTIRMQLRRVANFWHRLTAVSASFLVSAISAYANENSNSESQGDLAVHQGGSAVHKGDWPLLRYAASDKLMNAAIEFDQGHYAKALVLLDRNDLENPLEIAKCHYFRALCFQGLGLVKESTKEYDWVIENWKDPILLAKAEKGKKQLEKNSSVFTDYQIMNPMETSNTEFQAIRIDPQQPHPGQHVLMGVPMIAVPKIPRAQKPDALINWRLQPTKKLPDPDVETKF
jgi:hypothetical protein